jgi:polysaccharide deacetylase 2 family uncharacterized protein YibQ
MLKVLAGLAVLVVLVVAAGMLAHHFIQHRPQTARLLPPKPELPMHRTPEVEPSPDRIPEVPAPDMRPQPPEKTPALPQVAIIIDDIGYDRAMARKLLALDTDLTFSVLPFAPHSRSIALEIRRRSNELMLHLPMEPEEYPAVDPGPGALLSAMTPDELLLQLRKNLDAVPGIKGVNNHMGSRLTAESSRMYQIFTVLKKEGFFFIDSRSTPHTMGRPSARMFNLPFAERDVFLDHEKDPNYIRRQVEQMIRIAKENGQAVAIGHPYAATYQVLQEMLPAIKRQVQLVPASAVVNVLADDGTQVAHSR